MVVAIIGKSNPGYLQMRDGRSSRTNIIRESFPTLGRTGPDLVDTSSDCSVPPDWEGVIFCV
jgi:hypothetical protein